MPWNEIADDVFYMRYKPLDQTIGAIRTDDGLVVIDSRSHRSHAKELTSDLCELDRRPASILVNTHYHWDHTFGNAQFPDAMIVGHERTRIALQADGPAVKAQLAAADWIDEDDRRLIADVSITPPTATFTNRMSLFPGGRHIGLHYLGRGHTDSDIVITVDNVLFAGDLIEVGAPPSFGDSFPEEWAATLELVSEMCAGPVVPGHGDVVDRTHVVRQHDEILRAVSGESVYTEQTMATIRSRSEVG